MWNYMRTAKDIERSITHFDLEREIHEGAMRRFSLYGGRVRVRDCGPRGSGSGGGLTNMYGECIYTNQNAGTAKNTFTTEFQINDTAGMGPVAKIPANWFFPGNQIGKTLKIFARGITSVTGTPTWQWNFRFNPTETPNNPPTGPIVAGNPGTLTSLTGVSNQLWEAEFDVQMVTPAAAGNNSTLRGLGMLSAPGLFTLTANQVLFGGGASPGTVATFDYSVANTLSVGVVCGTSNAANQVQLLQLIMIGYNNN